MNKQEHVYIIKNSNGDISAEYAVMTEEQAKVFFGGGVRGFSASILRKISPDNYAEMNVPQSVLDQLK